jgi:two-component system, LytTR family, response regulator
MENTIRTILIEDERKSLMTLETLLERYCPEVTVVGTGKNVEEGIRVLRETHPDLVFLDIAMPDGDAFDLLDRFGKIDFEIIFITAYNEYALKAFEFSALHYLLKPVNYLDLQRAVQRFRKIKPDTTVQAQLEVMSHNLHNHFDKITLPGNDGLEIINIQDIIRIEASSNYSLVYLINKDTLIISKTMNQFEEILRQSNFIRIHNTHMVNLMHVKKYQRGQGGLVILDDGTQLAVSRSRKMAFLEGLKSHSLTIGV